MAYELKDNSGALFKNDEKPPGDDRLPNYKGRIMAGGVEYYLNAWLNDTKDGRRFLKLSLKPKEARPAPPPSAPQPAGPEDDVPF